MDRKRSQRCPEIPDFSGYLSPSIHTASSDDPNSVCVSDSCKPLFPLQQYHSLLCRIPLSPKGKGLRYFLVVTALSQVAAWSDRTSQQARNHPSENKPEHNQDLLSLRLLAHFRTSPMGLLQDLIWKSHHFYTARMSVLSGQDQW